MKFIGLLSFLIIAACSSGVLNSLITNEISSRPSSNYQFSILQGTTDATSTVLRLVYPNYLVPRYKVIDSSGKQIPVKNVIDFERKAFEFKVTHVFIENLKPHELYTFEVTSQDEQWNDKRTFKTIDVEDKELKILVASCMSDSYNEIGNKIWPQAFSKNPDLVFLIGDNLYADVYSGVYIGSKIPTSVEHLWRRHIDHAMMMKVYRMEHLKPTFTTWDDHDYGLNNGDKNYKNKKESAKIFHTFFPTYNNKFLKKGPGVSNVLTLEDHQFVFMDARSYRDSESDKSGYHFGKKQRKWAFEHISKFNGLNWMISGDQLFGAYHPYESFEGLHPVEFKNFKNEIRETGKNLIFMSGDRHLVEVINIPENEFGKASMEYTISGIHTKMYPGSLDRDPNERRVDGFDGEPNFAIFTLTKKGESYDVEFDGYSIKGLKINRLDTFSK